MNEHQKKEIPFERALFFSDAVVAIAITLLALDLRLELPEDHQLTFSDLLLPWKNYVAFFLSFINISSFWRTHHHMYTHINKMNERTLALNIAWLFFIVTLPYSTSVLSTHFGTAAAVFLYSLNIFLISIFQNFIWDTSDIKEGYIDASKLSDEQRGRFRIMFNLDMLNGLISIVLSFWKPTLAFCFLFFKIPIFIFGAFYIARLRKNMKR